MALSGSFNTSPSYGRYLVFKWTATQPEGENASIINWELVGAGSDGYVVCSELHVTIDGVEVLTRPASHHVDVYVDTVFESGVTTLKHSSDGTKSFSVRVTVGIYNWYVNCSGNGTFTLDKISQSSYITSVNDTVLGENTTVKWMPESADYKYALKFTYWNYFSKTTEYIDPVVENGVAKETSFTAQIYERDLANYMPAADATATVYLYKFLNGKQVGNPEEKNFKILVPEDVVPTITTEGMGAPFYVVINDKYPIMSDWVDNQNKKIILQNHSTLGFYATANEAYSAKIVKSIITGHHVKDGVAEDKAFITFETNGDSLVRIFPNANENLDFFGKIEFQIEAIDSRGRKSDKVAFPRMFVCIYAPPEISRFSAYRNKSIIDVIDVRIAWQYSNVFRNNNIKSAIFYYQGTNQPWVEIGDKLADIQAGQGGVTLEIPEGFSELDSYRIKVVMTDDLDNSAEGEVFVPKAEVAYDFSQNGKGLGIGKVLSSSTSESLEVGWETVFYNDVYIMQGEQKILLADYIRSIINGG